MANPIPGTQIVPSQQDPWEEAFQAYQNDLKVWVDLNGDGVPDVAIPVNRERQAISKRAMAGRDPVLSPQERQRLIESIPQHEANNQAFERGMSELVLGQPIRAGKAIGKAYEDPSLANLTNAGVQTALTIPTTRGAMTAAKIGGAGLSAAAAQDFGLFPAAEAGQADRDRARAAREQARAARANAEAERARAEAERAMSEQRLKEQREGLANAENDAAVRRAIAARDAVLNDRPRKFSETKTGQVFDELGMVAPMIPGAIAGGLAGSGMRAAGYGHKAVTGTGVGVGGVFGAAAGNWPLGHELMVARPYNPEKEAYKAGAREMPASDARKKEWADYAAGLSDENPARRVALNELMNIPMTMKRSALPMLEGAGAGWAAVDLPGAVGRLIGRGRGSGPGSTGGPTMGQGAGGGMPQNALANPPGTPQNYSSYLDLPPQVRKDIQSKYIADRAVTGRSPVASRRSQDIKDSLSAQGIEVPVTDKRVSATNKIIDAFVAQHGRLPNEKEFAQVFNRYTLGIPLAAGASAGPLNNLLAGYYTGDN